MSPPTRRPCKAGTGKRAADCPEQFERLVRSRSVAPQRPLGTDEYAHEMSPTATAPSADPITTGDRGLREGEVRSAGRDTSGFRSRLCVCWHMP